MSWMGRWLLKVVDRERNNCNVIGTEVRSEGAIIGTEVRSEGASPEFGPPLNITVYTVTGGTIVKCSHYARNRDRTSETTYIIHPDENMAESVAKLIVLEGLKR